MGLVGVGAFGEAPAAVMAACGGAPAREDDGAAMEGFSKAGRSEEHGNERGNSQNALERGEHELQRVEESRF